MQERELRAHIAALLIAARHVVVAYGHASAREQNEAIDRLRRIVKNVERRVATSSDVIGIPDEAAPRPGRERVLARKEVPYPGGHRSQSARGRVTKPRPGHR